ncbi:Bax inhibitor-1/YccA family protein [Acholeplasma hippikon]|uniref:Predicted membrane protein n=1 Tax=Acholeplasma hippikon TaxID=264636 RepID=A0A449BK88_9MOLU|nr:Bax inhibitor-1/YccA family protein [Acholeplasma hippikon]VEU82840.1 Predicted membrane protein [Acholeplasma hippikon]
MRSTNPIFERLERENSVYTGAQSRTGVVTKTALLIGLALLSGFLSIYIPADILVGILIPVSILTFVASFIAIISRRFAAPAAIIYSVGEGLIYGILTHILELAFPGIGLIAIVGTLSVFLVMFTLYSTGLLRASSFLKKFVLGGLISIVVGSLLLSITSLINPAFANAFYANTSLLIAIYLGLIVFGGFMLITDFDRAESVVEMGLGKNEEWLASMGIMITLIWIYINLLRLLIVVMNDRK